MVIVIDFFCVFLDCCFEFIVFINGVWNNYLRS